MEYGLVFPLMLFIPIFYTIWNLCILIIKRECWYSNFWFTLIAGGYLYYMMIRYCPERVDWDVQLDCYQLHSFLSVSYIWTVIAPIMVGVIALCILKHLGSKRVSPWISAALLASILHMNILQILTAIQLIPNLFKWSPVSDIAIYPFLFHLNILILSIAAIKSHLTHQWSMNELKPETENLPVSSSEQKQPFSHQDYLLATLFFLFIIIVIWEIVYLISGKGADALFIAFTETSDWTFSVHDRPPNLPW